MLVDLIQFKRPTGWPVEGLYEVSDDLADRYESLSANGCRLTAEVLTTGEVSFTVEDEGRGDFDGELAPNDGSLRQSLEALIGRFDADAYRHWATMMDGGGPDA